MISFEAARAKIRKIRARLWGPELEDPVFVIGCGRSGTTILGTVLSMHRAVTYLNERRDLWIAAYPSTDIWSAAAAARGGKLVLTAADADARRSVVLKRLFRIEVNRSGRPLLIEKLPINCFRLGFIASIFPRARFIHIKRNGLEVARSIERYCESQEWFGVNGYKWALIRKYAEGIPAVSDLPQICASSFEKGLLEWRLGLDLTHTFLASIPGRAYIELDYADFVENPVASAARICSFLALDPDPEIERFVGTNISRRSERFRAGELSDRIRRIGGELLQSCLDETRGVPE